jgi:hypothetical protein
MGVNRPCVAGAEIGERNLSSRAKLWVIWVVLVMGGPWLIACAKSHSSDESAPAADKGMLLYVDNHNLLDVRVFLLRDGQRSKIGTVPSMTKRTFWVSAAELGGAHELQLLADPIGSRDAFSTKPIPVQPGAIIEWQVEKDLRFSSILLR